MLGRWGGSSLLQLVMEDRLACNRYDAVPRERVVWSTHFLPIFSDENQYCFVFFFFNYNFAPSSAVGEESSKRGVPISPSAL